MNISLMIRVKESEEKEGKTVLKAEVAEEEEDRDPNKRKKPLNNKLQLNKPNNKLESVLYEILFAFAHLVFRFSIFRVIFIIIFPINKIRNVSPIFFG